MELENILKILLKGWLKILFLVLQPGVSLMTHFTIMFYLLAVWYTLYNIHVCSIQGASNRIREDYEEKNTCWPWQTTEKRYIWFGNLYKILRNKQ